MMQVKCHACGFEVIEGAKFCPECGTPVVKDDCSIEVEEAANAVRTDEREDAPSHPIAQPYMPSNDGEGEFAEHLPKQEEAIEPDDIEPAVSDGAGSTLAVQQESSETIAGKVGYIIGALFVKAKKHLSDAVSAIKSNKSVMIGIAAALVVFTLIMVANCAGGASEDALDQQPVQAIEAEPDPLNWPSKGLAAMLPVPESAYGNVLANSDAEFCAIVSETSSKEYGAYVAECMDKGFNVEPLSEGYAYTAENEQGYTLSLQYSEQSSEMTIELVEPTFAVTVNVDCMQNLFLSTYAIKVYVDETELGIISHGSEGSYTLQLPEGTHTIRVEKDESSDVFGALDFVVESDGEFNFEASCHSSYVGIERVVAEAPVEEVEQEAPASEVEKSRVEPSEENNSEATEPEMLTVDNCPELAEILSLKDSHSTLYSEFARKYEGRTICFDGRIDYIANHGSYKTRYDVLVSAGDYDANSQSGPSFKFEDVNRYDMGLTADGIYVGMNVYIVAEVESYNSTSGLFFLDPISIDAR